MIATIEFPALPQRGLLAPGPAHHFFSCSAQLLRTVFEEVVIKERKKRKGEE